MPLWSRSCCTNRAWPLLPRSWQNSKLSREVFANQDLIKAGKKKTFKKELCGTFHLRSVKWIVYFLCVSLSSLLDSFHQRPDRRNRWWVDHILLQCSKTPSICWSHCNTDPTFLCQCKLFTRKCDSENPPVIVVLLYFVETTWSHCMMT